jgi:hypothetical protein
MCDNQQPSKAKYLTVKLTYFKPRGKYYSEGEFTVDAAQPLHKIWDTIDEMIKDRKLPDLIEGHSPYIVLVNVPGHMHEHPILLNTSCVLQSSTN